MSLIYLTERLSRGNKIISEWYHFWPHFAYVFNGLIVQNGIEFGAIVARMKLISGTVLYFAVNFGARLYGI